MKKRRRKKVKRAKKKRRRTLAERTRTRKFHWTPDIILYFCSGGVGAMKGGDYMIHVFVEKIKEINVPDGGTVDPMVVIEVLGQKKYSSAKDDIGGIGETIYNEHIFVEPRGVDKVDAEGAKIMIKLVDKGFLKDALIGQFEFDMSFIYFMKDHLLLHKWLALSNPNGEDFAKIQAYMKVSIAVACQGDEQI